MVCSILRVQKNKNITLPTWLMRRFQVEPGDFVQLRETRQGVLMKPGRLVDPSGQQQELFRLLDKFEKRSRVRGLTEADVSREIKVYRKTRRTSR